MQGSDDGVATPFSVDCASRAAGGSTHAVLQDAHRRKELLMIRVYLERSRGVPLHTGRFCPVVDGPSMSLGHCSSLRCSSCMHCGTSQTALQGSKGSAASVRNCRCSKSMGTCHPCDLPIPLLFFPSVFYRPCLPVERKAKL